jgi:hypothetical protein
MNQGIQVKANGVLPRFATQGAFALNLSTAKLHDEVMTGVTLPPPEGSTRRDNPRVLLRHSGACLREAKAAHATHSRKQGFASAKAGKPESSHGLSCPRRRASSNTRT